jgi:hypothetical protein
MKETYLKLTLYVVAEDYLIMVDEVHNNKLNITSETYRNNIQNTFIDSNYYPN